MRLSLQGFIGVSESLICLRLEVEKSCLTERAPLRLIEVVLALFFVGLLVFLYIRGVLFGLLRGCGLC